MKKIITFTNLMFFVFSMIILSSCSPQKKESVENKLAKFRGNEEIEIAPDKFITIGTSWKSVDEKPKGIGNLILRLLDDALNGGEWSHIGIPWNNKLVEWKGEPIPITLREYEGKLFLIAFDRSNMDKLRLRFYEEDGVTFKEINADVFPKRIATQNLRLERNPYEGGENCIIDNVQMAIDIDPHQRYFRGTLTASIWICLMTKKELYDIKNIWGKEADELLREYSQKFKPIKLTRIVKKRWPLPQWYLEQNKKEPNKYPIPEYFKKIQAEQKTKE